MLTSSTTFLTRSRSNGGRLTPDVGRLYAEYMRTSPSTVLMGSPRVYFRAVAGVESTIMVGIHDHTPWPAAGLAVRKVTVVKQIDFMSRQDLAVIASGPARWRSA